MYKNDPVNIAAKFNGNCNICGKSIKKGDPLYYWPATKTALCENCGAVEFARFISLALDEEMSKINSRL